MPGSIKHRDDSGLKEGKTERKEFQAWRDHQHDPVAGFEAGS
jgi:hypothetical protein